MIVDASVITGVLLAGPHSDWAADMLRLGPVMAPHHMPVEVCHVLRRRLARGAISRTEASDALRVLLEIQTELHPFEPFAARVWELRDTISPYDAWYVALAEALDVPLATLDLRLASAPGTLCTFVVPDDGGVG